MIYNYLKKYRLHQLEDVLEVNDSGIWGDADENGDYVLRSSDIQDNTLFFDNPARVELSPNNKSNKKLSDGDILVTKSSGSSQHIGKCALFINPNGRDYFFSNFMLRLRSNKEIVEPKWIYYWLMSEYGKYILSKITDTTSGLRNLNISSYLSQAVPIPANLNEQKKIISILDKADSIRQKRRETLRLADEFLRSTFLEMFGDPIKNSKSWKKEVIKKLGKVVTGSTPSSSSEGMWGGKIPFITPGDLENGGMPVKRFVTKEGAENSRVVRKGSTMVCCIGATIGKVDIAKEKSAFNQQINAVEWAGEINDYFALYLFRFMKPIITQRGSSTTLPILNKTQFENLEIVRPDITLQNIFAGLVEKTELLKRNYEQSLQESENLFNSLMQRAFRGEL